MDPEKIKSLIEAMAASDLAEMEFSEDGWSLRLVRRHEGTVPRQASSLPAARGPARLQPVPDPPDDAAQAHEVQSPTFGIVYLGPAPGAPPFVSPGDHVTAGTTICILEAMKVFQEVKAGRHGVIAAVTVASGDEVEAGQALARFA
jgi:acetyl-CoA carboxylase biotin carboxyl carrier protein